MGAMIYAKIIIVFTPNLEFSPYSEAIHGSAVFRLTKDYQRLKQNDDLFNLILLFFLSFPFRAISTIWIQLSFFSSIPYFGVSGTVSGNVVIR